MTDRVDEDAPKRIFDAPAEAVQEAVDCTWCGARIADSCYDGDRLGGRRGTSVPHAQRWRDYWNATHGKSEQVAVYEAPWLAPFKRALRGGE